MCPKPKKLKICDYCGREIDTEYTRRKWSIEIDGIVYSGHWSCMKEMSSIYEIEEE